MEELNNLINLIMGTANKNYTKGEKNLQKFHDKLLVEVDDISLSICMYFFPRSPLEKNKEEFWFIKYKKEDKYDEYDFALILLNNYVKYMKEKDKKKFTLEIKTVLKQFCPDDPIYEFASLADEYLPDFLSAIIAFFTKDTEFFKHYFELDIPPENIQTFEYLQIIQKIIDLRMENVKKKEDIDNMIELLKISKESNNETLSLMTKKIKELLDEVDTLQKQNIALNAKNKELSEKLDQIYLRDTIKLSFKYLYKVFHSKYNEIEYKTFFWDQIKQIKDIINKPIFIKYKFISDFIEDISYSELTQLNDIAHAPSLKKRNFSDIQRYLQKSSNADLAKVVEFFKDLPHIQEFISIYSIYYLNQAKAEEKFSELMDFSDSFEKIFKIN